MLGVETGISVASTAGLLVYCYFYNLNHDLSVCIIDGPLNIMFRNNYVVQEMEVNRTNLTISSVITSSPSWVSKTASTKGLRPKLCVKYDASLYRS